MLPLIPACLWPVTLRQNPNAPSLVVTGHRTELVMPVPALTGSLHIPHRHHELGRQPLVRSPGWISPYS